VFNLKIHLCHVKILLKKGIFNLKNNLKGIFDPIGGRRAFLTYFQYIEGIFNPLKKKKSKKAMDWQDANSQKGKLSGNDRLLLPR